MASRVLAFTSASRLRGLGQPPTRSARATLLRLAQDFSILAVRRPVMLKVFAEQARRATKRYRTR